MSQKKARKLNLKVLNDCILVEPLETEDDEPKEIKTAGGIILPSTRRKERDYTAHVKGIVVDVGMGRISGGVRVHNICVVGDIVYYKDGGYTKVTLDGIGWHLLNEDNVMAIEKRE